jgi:hypothetical protein
MTSFKFICSAFIIFFSGHSYGAAQQYAISQYDLAGNGKLMVINGFKAAECQKLIDTFYSGLKVDCPRCTKDYGGCQSDISPFQAVWANQNYPFPYVSSGNMRYIRTGISRQEIIQWCEATVQNYQKVGRAAQCIK